MRKLFITTCLSGVFFLLSLNQVQAQTNPALGNEEGTRLFKAIKLAQATLQTEVDTQKSDSTYKAVTVTSKKAALPVKLALWQKDTDQLLYLTGKKTSKLVTLDDNKTYTIKIKLDNGVNSQYEVKGEPAAYVVAVIHPIFQSIGTRKKPKFKLENVVYVPYHDYLNIAAIINEGKTYFNDKINAVYSELTSLGVKSHAYPNKLLAEVIDPVLIKSIIAIEHVGAIKQDSAAVTQYLNKFYVTLATNRHFSFAYAASAASARGIAQFIPSTYKLIVKSHPELVLNKNFEQGMVDPYNAIKAAVGLLDDNLSKLPQTMKDAAQNDDKKIGAYLAAGYNGGITRVIKAFNQWGEDWASDRTAKRTLYKKQEQAYLAQVKQIKKQLAVKKISKAQKTKLELELKTAKAQVQTATRAYQLASRYNLKPETVYYVSKYHKVYDSLASESQAYVAVASN
ncbi:MAG: transglycosylase SLT domain-containing protein [Candidatus Kerfeldbacteria bacterium]|nr:transglycosylase SLT domain-containing protein [Candidatus Kerfeldbacteria bacterium]